MKIVERKYQNFEGDTYYEFLFMARDKRSVKAEFRFWGGLEYVRVRRATEVERKALKSSLKYYRKGWL